MKTKLQFGLAAALVLTLTVMFTAGSYSQGTVTFRVNMNVQTLLGLFNPATDSVTIHGGFTGWGNALGKMTLLTDTIYTQTFTAGTGGDTALSYKFFNNDPLAPNTGYETQADNRAWTPTGGDDTLPTVWFSNDSVYVPPPPPAESVNVTFRLNMAVQITEGAFIPATDYVFISGSFDGWPAPTAGGPDTLKPPTPGDSLYDFTARIPGNQVIQYKFTGSGLGWENNPSTIPNVDTAVNGNRSATLGTADRVLPIQYWDDVSTTAPPASVNVLYEVDMTAFDQLHYFNAGLNDSVHIRGIVNGWGDNYPDVLTPSLGNPDIYTLATSYSGHVGDPLAYKYHINHDTTHAKTVWPNFDANKDNYEYEHPYALGDANRVLNVTQASGDLYVAPYYFDGINPLGIIPAGHSVTLTFNVNMVLRRVIWQPNSPPATRCG